MTVSNESQSEKKEVVKPYFPLENLISEEKDKILGLSFKEFTKAELAAMQNGSYSELKNDLSYTKKDGTTLKFDGRVIFNKNKDGQVTPSFIMKKEQPEIKEFIGDGYKIKDHEKESLLSGNKISFNNKPLKRNQETGSWERGERSHPYTAMLDKETNNIIIRNMNAPFVANEIKEFIKNSNLNEEQSGKLLKDGFVYVTNETTQAKTLYEYDPIKNKVESPQEKISEKKSQAAIIDHVQVEKFKVDKTVKQTTKVKTPKIG